MSGLRATLFGRFKVERDDRQEIAGIEAGKVRELLAYLLVYRDRPQSRETLAELLWENQPPEKSKKNLRQTLWKLKSALDDHRDPGTPDLIVDGEWIQINPSARWTVDMGEFEQAVTANKNRQARELSVEDFNVLQHATELYQADLLEGWYQDWCISERERYQAMYLLLLDKLVQFCEIHQKCETGLAFGEKLLRRDRAYERAHRRMMRLYYLAGDRTGALRQYGRCTAALQEELGVGPSERTVELYEQIKTERFRRAVPAAAREVSRPGVAETGNTAQRLNEFTETLSGIPSQISREAGTTDNNLPGGR
jgi:DNA-binding SARP family transcriptional activator